MSLAIVPLKGPIALGPRRTEFNVKFWQGLAEGEFRCIECADCARLSFPPKLVCPGCHSTNSDWRALQGRGTIYSLSTIHAVAPALAADGPVRVAVVDLDEGLRIVVRLLDDDCMLNIGDSVELVITLHDGEAYFFAARRPIEQAN